MMTLEEKFRAYDDLLWTYFIVPDKESKKGTNIPCNQYNFKTKKKTMGDGTINMAVLMTYLWLSKELEIKQPISLENCVDTLDRLIDYAHHYFNDKFSFLNLKKEEGFFIRDDCYQDDISWGNYKMLHTTDNEDPCHSPFTSQDQIWNLNPILKLLSDCSLNIIDKEKRNRLKEIGLNINKWLIDNDYKLYNPYLSQINHYFYYLPKFNQSVEQRKQEREDNYKPSVLVKRGQYNWYYAGGTLSCYNAFAEHKINNWFITTFYKMTIFALDRIWEPLLQKFAKNNFKHNSYHCYATCSGIWYNKNFIKRFKKRFEESLETGVLFEPNIAPIVLRDEKLDLNKLQTYLENFPEPSETGQIDLPLETYLNIYLLYLKQLNY